MARISASSGGRGVTPSDANKSVRPLLLLLLLLVLLLLLLVLVVVLLLVVLVVVLGEGAAGLAAVLGRVLALCVAMTALARLHPL